MNIFGEFDDEDFYADTNFEFTLCEISSWHTESSSDEESSEDFDLNDFNEEVQRAKSMAAEAEKNRPRLHKGNMYKPAPKVFKED
jgi:hypothetical protein